MVEHQLPKLRVAGSIPVSRSDNQEGDQDTGHLFYVVFSPNVSFANRVVHRCAKGEKKIY